MFRVDYSHRWKIPVPKEDVWMLFSRAFQNSNEVKQWPHQINEIRGKKALAPKGLLDVIYRLGPLHVHAPYVIQQVIPNQRIVYDTFDDHPLEGQSEIDLIDADMGTEVHWHGYYEPKSFSSLVSLMFFKLYFERVFFSLLESATTKAVRIKKSKHTISVEAA